MRTVEDMVNKYTEMREGLSTPAHSSMYEELRWQYKDMAKGGDGGDMGYTKNGESTCRGINYKGYPDSFFHEVSARMGWLPRKETITLEAYSADPI
jgi:hypothetical protein